VSNVSVCGMLVVLPVASLFSKTMVVAPATAVVGAVVYAVVLLPAVQLSVWAAAACTGGAFCAEAGDATSPAMVSTAASAASTGRNMSRRTFHKGAESGRGPHRRSRAPVRPFG